MKFNLDRLLNLFLIGIIAFLVFRYFAGQPDFSSGEQVPQFTGQKLDGEILNIEQLRGQYVLLDFWASWCGPCRRKNPGLVKLHERFHGTEFTDAEGFEIVSISLDRNAGAWQQAIETDHLDWSNHLLDRHVDGQLDNGLLADRFDVKQIPSTFLLGPDGKIIGVNLPTWRIRQLLSKRQS